VKFLIIVFSFFFVGCSSLRSVFIAKPPRTNITTPSGANLQQTGSAEIPAKISNSANTLTIPLPKQSGIAVFAPTDSTAGRVEIIVSDATTATLVSTSETAVAPKAYAPPSPPSPAEIARGDGLRMFYYIAAGLVLAACVLVYLGHGKAALIAGIGAVIVPTLANFLSSEWAVRALIACACLASALCFAWYLIARKNPEIVAKVDSEIAILKAKIT